MRSKSRIGAYILIGLGIIFLLSNLGWLPPLRSLMSQWWPLILIIVGILLLMEPHGQNPWCLFDIPSYAPGRCSASEGHPPAAESTEALMLWPMSVSTTTYAFAHG